MTDLTEFLEQRIAEDQEIAEAAREGTGQWEHYELPEKSNHWQMVGIGRADDDEMGHRAETMFTADAEHIARFDPARVLADCAAKRQIVELYVRLAAEEAKGGDVYSIGLVVDYLGGDVLRALASVYADHPQFDPAWSLS